MGRLKMKGIGAILVLTALIVMFGSACIDKPRTYGDFRNDGKFLRSWDHTDVFHTETFTLENGLQVILLPIPGSLQVTAMVWYKVGAADDPAGKSGLAHLVEHATFGDMEAPATEESTQGMTHPSMSEAEAFTSHDYTVYYHTVPLERLETVLHAEAARMTALATTDAVLTFEQAEVAEERREEMADDPATRLDDRLRTALYGTHPYGLPILGRSEEAQQLTTQDVTTFYRTWYTPNNAVLIVAGDTTAARLTSLVQRYYGSLPARPVPVRHRSFVPEPPGGQRLIMQDSLVREPIWQRMYLAPSYTAGATEHAYALQVLAEILMGAPEGRLYQPLVVQKQLATALEIVYLPDCMGITEFTLQITPAPGVEAAVLEQAIDHTLAAIAAKGVSRAEVQWAQHRLHRHASLARTHDSTGAELLGVALTTGRALVEVQRWRDRIAAVTREQVEAAVQAVLRTEWSVTGILLPAAADNVASGERLRTAK